MQTPLIQNKKYVAGLDIVRFLSAAMVMTYHLLFWRNGKIPRLIDDPHNLWWFGWVGVEIFFVISGYVIAFSAQFSTPGQFARSRFLRLAPTVWVCATITLVATLALSADIDRRLVYNYLATLIVKPVGSHIDVVYWTLTVEIAFYFLVFLVLRFSSFHTLAPLMVVIGAISSLYIVVLNTDILHSLPPMITSLLVRLSGMRTSRLLLLQHGCFFALGVMLWKLAQRPASPAALLVTIALACTSTLEVHFATAAYIRDKSIPGVFVFSPVIVWLVALLLISYFIIRGERANPRSRAVNAVLRFLGLITFPLYLIHNNVGVMITDRLITIQVPAELSYCIAMGTCLGLSALTVLIFEPLVKKYLMIVMKRISTASRSRIPRVADSQ